MFNEKFGLYLVPLLLVVLFPPASADECGKLCSAEWMVTATTADIKQEIASRSNLPTLGKNDCTPLHTAALYNPDPRVSELLVEFGSNLEDHCGRYGVTPLYHAAGGEFGVARFTLGAHAFFRYYPKYGFDRAQEEQRKLDEYMHATGNNPTVVESLLKIGASVSAQNTQGSTPLHYAAASTQHPRIIELLLQYGAEIDAKDNSGHTPLHWAAFLNTNPRVMEVFLDHGADYEIQARIGNPMHYAAAGWATLNLKILIDRGFSMDSINGSGQTPLHIASTNRIVESARVLLDNNAELETVDFQGKTPLQQALIKNTNANVSLLLIERGADADVKDGEGRNTFDLLEARRERLERRDLASYKRLKQALIRAGVGVGEHWQKQ